MTSYVLVPGMCHGGWCFERVAGELRERGHRVDALTLTGLARAQEIYERGINLDTHLDEAAAAVRRAASEDGPVVLVGHSYGGSVITGVADRDPGAVRALVFLDAFVPQDGDTCFALAHDEERSWYLEGARTSGLAVDPLPFFDQRALPHPLGTVLQVQRLTGAWRRVAVKHYVAALDWPGPSPLATSIERVRDDPEFAFQEWNARHNLMRDAPDQLLELLANI